MSLSETVIAFIGAGNMAAAMVKGLIRKGLDPRHIRAADPDREKLQALRDETGIQAASSNTEAVNAAGAVVLAVKPQVLEDVVGEIRPALETHPCLLLSIAAGVTLKSLEQWAPPGQAIVRCMPNTPALVMAGASGLYANAATGEERKQLASDILSAVGTVCWLPAEEQLDAVTALSGSGPAYFFLLMEAMQEAGVELGLDRDTATELCLQTALGAARLARESGVPVSELRRRVTSPGGTTEAALDQFARDGFREIVARALDRAAVRARELAEK